MTEAVLPPVTAPALDLAVVEEQGWIERARAGDLEAFDSIMTCYETRLLRFLIGLVGDVEIAQELCQDTFLAAYQALPKVKGELRLSAWLHTIALNKARSHHRSRKYKTFVSIDDHVVASATVDPQDAVPHQDLVRSTLGQIPKQYAEALLLHISSGLSCREMAAVIGCSEGALKVRLMRARVAFRKAYDTESQEPCTI